MKTWFRWGPGSARDCTRSPPRAKNCSELLSHALAKAGNATLMTAELMDTLVDHSAGNYRLLMTMGARTAGLRHGPRSRAARREVLPGGLSADTAAPCIEEESEGLKMTVECT